MKYFKLGKTKVISTIVLLLGVSFNACNKVTKVESGDITFDEFITEHVKISNDLIEILRQEPNIEVNNLYKEIENEMNIYELGEAFRNAKIVNHDEMATLTIKIAANIERYIESNSEFPEMSEEVRFKMLSDAITSKFIENEFLAKSKLGSCEDARDQGSARCRRNWAIGMAAAGVSGYISFGAGWVVGVAAIQAVAVLCEGDVQSDYRACVSESE